MTDRPDLSQISDHDLWSEINRRIAARRPPRKPKCECGSCKTCKWRAAARSYRARAAALEPDR